MISNLYYWAFPKNTSQSTWFTEVPNLVEQGEIDEVVQRLRSGSLFTDQDTFGCAENIRTSLKGDRIRIQYIVKNTARIFANNPSETYAHIQFDDGKIGLVSRQLMVDHARHIDHAYVQVTPNLNVKIAVSEPRLDINDIVVRWHEPDHSLNFSSANVLLEKLRNISNNNMRVFTCLTQVLTQTPFNDMFKLVSAYLHEKYSVIVINGSNQTRENILSDPRFRGYKIKAFENAMGERIVKVTTIIAGYFSACAVKNSLELVQRTPNKNIGWYRCAVTYDLHRMTAFADFEIIAYPESWSHNEFLPEEDHEQVLSSPLNADLEEAVNL